MTDDRHPIEWFEKRIGQIIYREPVFPHEKDRPTIPLKIKDKRHAEALFQLQKNTKSKGYSDTPHESSGSAYSKRINYGTL